MLSWHNDPALKAEVVERMRKHREFDEIVQGLYQMQNPQKASGYIGCAIGCTLPHKPENFDGWHAEVEREYGIPESIAYVIDEVFEGLHTKEKEHARFAVDVIEAIPVGVDLSSVPGALEADLRKKHPYLTRALNPLEYDWPQDLSSLICELSPDARGQYSKRSPYFRWVRDRLLHHLRALEPAPPLIQHIDIPEPEPILIRTVVNN